MATLIASPLVTSQLQNHMTDAHQQSVPADLPLIQPGIASAKKPKLSLQTTSLTSTYGSLTKGIGPNTSQATYTPTTTNTLTNQWDLSIRPSPISRTESPRPATVKPQLPYTLALPFGVRSILKNSPLPRQASVSASPRDTRRRVFFPQPKKVSFRSNLEDAIETTDYVARHVDLSSSDEESSEGTSANLKSSDDVVVEYPSPPPSRKRKLRREMLTPVETPTSDLKSDASKTSTISKCKRRKWQWTLPTPTQSSEETRSPLPIHSAAVVNEGDAETRLDGQAKDHEREEVPCLDDCEACQNQDPNYGLGSPPDVARTESDDRDQVGIQIGQTETLSPHR